jgi:acetolactate synthase I/II/III large subunit
VGLRCEEPGDLDAVIDKAMSVDDRPVVVDFVVHRDAMVWPMVAAGSSNDKIQYARGISPVWDRDEAVGPESVLGIDAAGTGFRG